MANITLSEEQLIQMVRQLPLERKIEIAAQIEAELSQIRQRRRDNYQQRLREFARTRGFNWDTMPIEERGRFVLAHIDEILLLETSDESKKLRESLTDEFRRLAKMQGLDWDTLSEDERLAFVDELLDEGLLLRTPAGGDVVA